MTTDQVISWVRKFVGCRVLVLGDLILDEYLWGHVQRISPEAPVPILNLVSQEDTLGGGGNVVKNLCSLGARALVHGVVGGDATGHRILEELDRLGAERGVIEEKERKSSLKTRLMSIEHGQQVFRFDQESTHWIAPATEDALLSLVRQTIAGVQAVLCSDYLKGVLTQKVLQGTIATAREHRVPVVIDPKDSDPGKYRGTNVLTPNLRELEMLAGARVDGTERLTDAALSVMRELQVDSLLVTRGREGMSLFECAAGSTRRVDIPTVAQTVYDVSGAGDTVVGVFTLAMVAGADPETAARLANLAAGIVVGKRGTATVTPEEMIERAERE